MNRRAFFGGLFAILPAATCYKRIWKEIAGTEMPPMGSCCPPGPDHPQGEITIIWEEDGVEVGRDTKYGPTATATIVIADSRLRHPISPCTLSSQRIG
jgi:hypothetical protein